MIRYIKLWWYRECRSGAMIDEIISRHKMEKAAQRLAHYEDKIRALTVSGDHAI